MKGSIFIAVFVALVTFTGSALAVEGDVPSLSKAATLSSSDPGRPSGRDTTEIVIGTPAANNVIPFWGQSYDACRFQVLFLQSEINTLGDIVEFAFMPGGNTVTTYNNVRVEFCHTSVTQLSSVFDNNYAGNTPVEVINEPTMSIGGPANQWMPWNVTFSYNNADNLLVEIKWNGDSGQNVGLLRTGEAVPRRVYAWDDNASSGTLQNTGNYVRLKIVTVGIEENPSQGLKTALGQNLPNPFHGLTRISYTVERSTPTKLTIYDASGRQIRTLIDRVVESGIHTTVWDGRDENGRSVRSGVYFYRFESGSTVQTKKMICLR